MVLTKVPGTLIADASITSTDIQDTTITNAKMAVDPSNASNLSSGDVPLAQLGNVPSADTTVIKDDIALLAFKTQANGSLARYNLVDQTVDDFQDSSGVNASASSGETRTSGYMYGATASYMGDGSDGALSTSGNVTYTALNTNGPYDADMVLKQYSTLTVNAGHTITVNQPCRGLFIYVSGDCTINGTISMASKGALANPNNSGGSDSNAVGAGGLQLGLLTPSGTDTFTNDGTGFNGAGTAVRTATANTNNLTGNGTIFSMSKLGAAKKPGPVTSDPGYAYGNDGNPGVTGGATISTGSGGTGQIQNDGGQNCSAGDGGAGGAFSGGAGGGGCYSGANNLQAGDGGDYGGAGGAGVTNTVPPSAGGAGNPGAPTVSGDPRKYTNAYDGCGGIIWLVVGGNLTIGANGVLKTNGAVGGHAYVKGGSSGGGAVFLLHTGTYTLDNTNTKPIDCDGGADPPLSPGPSYLAGEGGDGGFHTAQLDRVLGDMTLISNGITAVGAAPTKGDIVMTYSMGAGTPVLNTGGDLVCSISRDGGTTYTDVTLVEQGVTGGHNIVTAHDVDISSQPDPGSGNASMVWKIACTLQSASKATRIQAVSLGWS